MDLKLKDEITKLLIERPGLSISQLAKKTKNYYSYTHKILSEMQKQNLVRIEKVKQGKRMVTICRLVDDYKKDWVLSAKKFFKALVKDAEVKTAFLLMYGFLMFTLFTNNAPRMITESFAAGSGDILNPPAQPVSPGLLIVISIPILIGIWFLRKRLKFK